MNTMDEQDTCEVGQTAPITVAGRTVGNPLSAITEYLKKHSGTIRNYDFIAGTNPMATVGASESASGSGLVMSITFP
jgi:hypothetical protein